METVLGHVGRFVYQNHKMLIEIFKEVHKELPNSKLILVGIGPLKILLENKLKTMVWKMQLCLWENVMMCQNMQAMDVFITFSF